MDYNDTGLSVMELSHRSKEYEKIIAETESEMRKLLNVPNNFKVLFMTGGATQ